MNNFWDKVKKFVSRNRVQVVTVAAIIALTCLGAAISIYQSSRVSYPAVEACDLLTEDIAKKVLGDKVIGITSGPPITDNGIYTSKCSYTDSNSNTEDMKVAAVGVMSPQSAAGETTINTSFKSDKSSSGIQAIRDIGDSAFFDKSNGQLHVLYENIRLVFRYGVGDSIEETPVRELLDFAKTVLSRYNT